MLKFIAKIFGTKSEKDIKRIMPLVEQTKQEGETLKTLSNDALRAETKNVQDFISQELSGIDTKLEELHKKIADNPDLDLDDKEAVFAEIDSLEEVRNKDLEKVLIKVLPKAFAIVRETARRFKENEYLEVTAQEFDIRFSAGREHIQIDGDKARWANTWAPARR
jgi:preprotein translocase subunit SecA